jgi:flagellar hook assembly protein FlgD
VAIQYGLPRNAAVRLEVYDACGRLVRVIASGFDQAGYHTAVWKCNDQHGRAVAEGAYFVRLVADGATLTSKVVKTE